MQSPETKKEGDMSVSGVLPVIPTPLRDSQFDEESFGRFLDHMLDHVDGYTLLGSTGEAPSLRHDERLRIIETALGMTPRDKSVIVGVSDTCLADTLDLARQAQACGAAGVLCAVPYYFPNTADGIVGYLSALDAELEIDLVLYDNPASTKTLLDVRDMIRWSDMLGRLTAVKLTDHNVGKVAPIRDAGLTVFAGEDVLVGQHIAAGVNGAMVIAPALFPRTFRVAWDHAMAGRLVEAQAELARAVLPFTTLFGTGDEVAISKTALAAMEVFTSAEVRLPLSPLSTPRRELVEMTCQYCVDVAASDHASTAVEEAVE
jgi:4-hydroxy-tetrahydrodipicolinate synthase